jgi:hypothetical protein
LVGLRNDLNLNAMKTFLFFAFILLASCSHEPNYNAQGWKPEYRIKVKNSWINLCKPYKNGKDSVQKDKFCDCIVKEYEKAYPHGLPSKFNKKVYLNIIKDCASNLQ